MGCNKCNGSEWVLYTDESGNVIAKPCECAERAKTERRLKASGISDAFQKRTIESFNDKGIDVLVNAKAKAIGFINNYLEQEHTEHNSIMFLGVPGSGKTHLSLAIANKLLNEKGVGCLYMPFRETMTELKHLNSAATSNKYEEQMHKLSTTRLLIIDDLFKGTVSDADINYIFQIVNQRYLNQLPFILSSEKTPIQLLDIDEAIGSRLLEQAKGNTIIITNKQLNYRIHG